jgi:hypothetical protein
LCDLECFRRSGILSAILHGCQNYHQQIQVNRHLILFIVSLILLAIVISFDVNYFNYKAPIPYADWTTITWGDFRGHKRPYSTLYGDGQFASIFSTLDVEVLNEGAVQITSCFHPARSYVYSKNSMDKALLMHELYHFHITETIARSMRRKLSEDLKSIDLSGCLSTYQQKEDSMQLAYDRETYHGIVMSKQKAWQKKIDSSLLAMENFSNPIVIHN